MAASDDSGLYFIDPSDWPGAEEHRAKLAREQAESRRRYTEYLTTVLIGCEDVADASERADIVLDALTVWRRDDSEHACACGCHPRLRASDLHDYGFGCTCMKSPEERKRDREDWSVGMDVFWASPEGVAITAARDAEQAALAAWLSEHPEVVIRSRGGWAPEQWEGSVGGHSFYFRERHGDWHIELDLRPSGHFVKKWLGGDLGDEDSFEMVETTEGDVIAEGTIRAVGYGETPVERIQFIVDMIRNYLASRQCTVHVGASRDDLAVLFGESLRWCPSCGVRLS